MLRYLDCVTPLNWTLARLSCATSTNKQNQIYQVFRKRFNQRWLQFRFAYSFSICNGMFFLLTSLCWMSVFVCRRHFWWRQVWRHLHETVWQCWAKFSNGLICWSIRMIRAKNYKIMSKYGKVMPKIRFCPISPNPISPNPISPNLISPNPIS